MRGCEDRGSVSLHPPGAIAQQPSNTPSPANPRAGRIPGLDGLRALAVSAVLAFHLWPRAVPGGFLGVDVFFVISGFLITTLLLRERTSTGRNDLKGFWTRRARRLLPALVLVVVTSVAAARIVSGNLLVNIHRQVVGAVTFSTNWIEVIAGFDYFDHSAPSLFATFWSLAVEEQFYLLWPLLFTVLLAISTSRRVLWRASLAMAVASGVWMAVLYTLGSSTTRVYYGTDTHAFGIMAGVALAFALSEPTGALTSARWGRLRSWTGFVALCGLVVLTTVIDSDSAFTYRGGIQLAAMLAVAVVAALPGDPGELASLLDAKPLVWVGRRSYGIYLWHWPVLLLIAAAMPATAPGEPPSGLTVVLVILVTLALSEASYRWVEVPVIRGGFRSAWRSTADRLGGSRSAGATGESRARRLRFGLVASVGAVAVLSAVAVVGLATAPERSAAQRAVEAGQQAIAEHNARSSVTEPPGDSAQHNGSGAESTADPAAGGSSAEPQPPSDAPDAAPPAWSPALPVPPGDQMVGLGDSVMSGAAPALYERFPGILLDAEPIRQWRDAPAEVTALLDANAMRPVVVLSYGTNAGLRSDESRAALQEVLELLGPRRRVVLVNTVGISSWVPESNEILLSISAEHPNTIVADWHSTVSERPELLHDDRTHPNIEGISVYADLIAQSLDQLGPG